MNNLHQVELGLRYNLIFFGFVLLILIIILLAVRIYFYKQNVNYLEKEIICLEKNRGIPILGEENEKITDVYSSGITKRRLV
ncbi:hypothetical protein LMIV_p020 (plasmid) [Listeria monocytogenes FSL J1-208]|uniref:hypothetical protein n=1 Tax=Listeria monocytogenes TaxID=1639 RepID=UPI0001B4392B|nr:hypothetical protein [Listeria monocytogenes]EAE5923282.1 hypothetical protein [Listeria monocytogenes]EAG6688909.1 hypothetical protein [Listeria monocytogenes]EHY61355.1 hypothetical protein LMIV_p020 [Listeria monocytogenes FSL J1-208]QOF63835.1 hypothetical protein IFI77_14025 [Listeria monocytogenes FSL J1-208]